MAEDNIFLSSKRAAALGTRVMSLSTRSLRLVVLLLESLMLYSMFGALLRKSCQEARLPTLFSRTGAFQGWLWHRLGECC